MMTYSDPRDTTLPVAGLPLLEDQVTGEIILPTTEDIVLRLIHGWMIVRTETLCALSGFKRRTIQRTLASLEEKGWIKPLGLPPFGMLEGAREQLYTIGSSPFQPPYDFKPRSVVTRLDRTKPHRASTWETTGNWVVPAHECYVTEAAAWLVRGITNAGHRCLAVPEQVLRRSYGWHSLKKHQAKLYFHTPVPDAWLIYGGYSLRLEVQISKTTDDKVEAVCEGSPLHEPVLYVVNEDRKYHRLLPFLNKYPHFFLARLGNAEDLAAIPMRYQRLVDERGFPQWWMRDYYSSPSFAYAVMNPEAAYLFTCEQPQTK